MAKRKRVPSPKQLSKEYHDLARESNKLVGTKFNTRKKVLSRYAINKIEKLKFSGYITGQIFDPANAPKPTKTLLRAPRKIIREAKAKGFEVVGGKISVPNKPDSIKRFRRAIRTGYTPGVTPVGDGAIEHVILPWDMQNMQSLLEAMRTGEIDNLKDADEYFAFKFFGRNSNHKPFKDGQELYQYLAKYKSLFDLSGSVRAKDLTEEFEHFELLRFSHYPWAPSPPDVTRYKKQRKRRERIRAKADAAAERQRQKKYENEAARKAAYRERQSDEQRARRLELQRIYQKKWRRYQKD